MITIDYKHNFTLLQENIFFVRYENGTSKTTYGHQIVRPIGVWCYEILINPKTKNENSSDLESFMKSGWTPINFENLEEVAIFMPNYFYFYAMFSMLSCLWLAPWGTSMIIEK